MPEPTKPSKTSRKAPPVVKPTVTIKKTSAPASKTSPPATTVITSEERHGLIAEAAYYLAEKRGFQGGSAEQDWLDAAAQVDTKFMGAGKCQDT